MRRIKRFQLTATAAKDKGIPRSFVGVIVKWTDRAIQICGRATTEGHCSCMLCGRPLTHPLSVLLGIGPECGKHWWNESELGPYGFTEAHAERLRSMIRSREFRLWFRRRDVQWRDCDEPFDLPEDLRENAADGSSIGGDSSGSASPSASVSSVAPAVGRERRAELVAGVGGAPGVVKLFFPYDAELVASVRAFPDRHFVRHPEPHWVVRCDEASLRRIGELGFVTSPSA
jgi:hypothetical protein